MGNFKCCPECGSEQITDEKHGGSYLIVCRECGFAVGPYALLWQAIEKWNGLESYSDLPTVTHERKWQHDTKFAFMYEVLKAMGYKMSDDEIQLLDGTHKIYEGDHKT